MVESSLHGCLRAQVRGSAGAGLALGAVVEAGGGPVGEVDVVVLGELAQDVLPDQLLGDAALARLAQVPDRQQAPVLADARVHRGGQVRVEDHEFPARFLDALLGRLDDLLGVPPDDVEQQLLGLLPIALEGDEHRDLVPDVLEALAVVRDDVRDDLAVGDVDDAAGALVGVHPVADLVQGELEYPDVDHVAGVLADLDAVADREGAPPDDEDPARQIEEDVLEGDRDACRHQAEVGGEILEPLREPDLADDQDADGRRDVRRGLLPAVAQPGAVGAAPDEAQHNPLDRPQRQHDYQRVEDPVFRLPADAERRLQPAAGLVQHASPPGVALSQYGILYPPGPPIPADWDCSPAPWPASAASSGRASSPRPPSSRTGSAPLASPSRP